MSQPPPARSSTASSSRRPSLLSRAVTRLADKDEAGPSDKDKGPLGLSTLSEAEPGQAVVADIIFVHGINGGSQSTWSKGGQEANFWPREWLPRDGAFCDARIHTFGYASGVRDTSVLDISDFAKRLLSEIHDSPAISHGSKSGIIFVAHSMGGLVVKQAVVLANQHAEFQPIVDRTVSILFLATPHHGAAIARAASKLVALMPGSRPFLGNLKPDSAILKGINEDFPRHCEKMKLVSFCETRPLSILGVNKTIIVPKESAVMNLPNERRTYLDADHRNVAMYSSQEDPSYMAVRNALATVLYGCRSTMSSTTQSMEEEEQEAVDRFLGVSSAPDDDMMVQRSLRFPGSCEWAMENEAYRAWRASRDCRFLWFRGRPGAGKSVLASRIIWDLQESGVDTSFFFFQSGDKTKSTLNAWLRSTAWQMARLNGDVLAKLRQVMADTKQLPVDKVDYYPVWRKVYLSGLLRARLDRPQFWVIDAVDECKESSDLLGLLARIPNQWPVSVLVTSRHPAEALGASNALDMQSYTISEDDTRRDIGLYLQANLPRTAMILWKAPEDLLSRIVERARGCFLWAKVVCDELQKVTSSNEVTEVLQGIPADMDSLYGKILDELEHKDYGRSQAKALITWTQYAFRPLTTAEMQEPVEMEIRDSIGDMETAIARCCGNLVHVDKNGRIRLMHLTAREYLGRISGQSDFALSKAAGHRQLAMTCLQYLMDMDKAAARSRRSVGEGGLSNRNSASMSNRNSATGIQSPFSTGIQSPFSTGIQSFSTGIQSPFSTGLAGTPTGDFAAYASMYVFQHVNLISSKEGAVLEEIAKFMGSTACLRWIERLARQGSLATIYQAGKTLNALLSRWAQHSPPVALAHGRQSLALLHVWGDDLIHLVTKFARWLREAPQSIHHLIPPLCPAESAIRKQFARPRRGLAVQGLAANRQWDDCLTTITYAAELRPNLLAAGLGFFAVGTINADGRILVYDDAIFQERHVLRHGEPVWQLVFSERGDLLVAAGVKHVRIWATATGAELARFRIPHRCMALAFGDEGQVLRVATAQNELLEWDLAQQAFYPAEATTWADDLEAGMQGKQPLLLDFAPCKELLCVVYRGQKLLVWDHAQDRLDTYDKGRGSPELRGVPPSPAMPSAVRAIAMSRGADASRVAATYTDGDLHVYDVNTGEPLAQADNANTMLLASSGDGRTLAGVDSQGTVTLFEFATLRVLYRIQFDKPVLPRAMAFTADNLRFMELRGKQCRVWGPAALLRTDLADDENSDTVSVASGPQEVDCQLTTAAHITALAVCRASGLVFYGTADGSVCVHDGADSTDTSPPLLARDCGITLLAFDETQSVLLCADQSSRITAHRIATRSRGARAALAAVDSLLVDTRPPNDDTLTQVLFSEHAQRLLACTHAEDCLLRVAPEAAPPASPRPRQGAGAWLAAVPGSKAVHWLPHPTNPQHLVRASPTSFALHQWSDLALVRTVRLAPGVAIDSIATLHHDQYFTTLSPRPADHSVHLWSFDCLEAGDGADGEDGPDVPPPAAPVRRLNRAATRAEQPLGAFGTRAVVYTQDNWVATMDLGALAEDAFVRHFFIPNDWVGDKVRPLMAVGVQGDIYFACNAELAVIKRGLEVTEAGAPFNPRRHRQSTALGKGLPFRGRSPTQPVFPPRAISPGSSEGMSTLPDL